MVRKGSSVRVRQRAFPAISSDLVPSAGECRGAARASLRTIPERVAARRLRRIADVGSGIWATIAADALREVERR
jgi:hypothetical protein